jgi:stringent starvation protein B
MDKQLEELYGLVPEGMFSDINQFKETIDSEGPDVIYGFIPDGMFSDVNQFKEVFSSVFQPQEELTPEMMETGQRDAAPAYAMTEEKYAAEKKSPTESPLQDGVSVGVEAEIPPTPTTDFTTYEQEIEVSGTDTRKYGYVNPLNQLGTYATQEDVNLAEEQYKADQEFTAKKIEAEETTLAELRKKEEKQAEEERALAEKANYEINLDEGFLKDLQVASVDMMGKKEGEVVPMMNDIYSKYGFSFRKTGIDNEMQVIADNGEKMFIELKPILRSTQIDSSRRLQKFLKDNAIPVTKEIAEVEKNEVKNATRALNLRNVGRLNDDGTESTVLMTSGEVDGKYVAYPTLFPKDPNNYTSAASSWMELDGMDAVREAVNRNELFYFDTEEEAQKFAEGSWKEFSNADAEADLFFEKKGLNYMAYKNNYERFEYALDRSEFLKEAPRFEDELTEDEIKEYGDLYVNGTLRSDAGKIQEDLEKEADGLRDFVNDKDYLVTRYEFDSYMQEKYEKKAQIAVTTNNISKAQIEKVNDMSVEFFGVPLNELSKYQPKTQEDVDRINSIVEAYNEAMTTRQMAANQYDVANTYLNEKFEKSIRGKWLENGAAFNDAVKKGWYNGRAADAIMMESLGFTDITQSGMSWNDVSPEDVAQKIVDALSETETGKNSIVAQRFHSSKNFKDIWDTFKDDPAELALTMAAESMAQLLPMALKIVPTTTAVGAGVGAGIGATGFMAGPTGIVTTTGGALTGGAQGFRTGMSAVAFAMEYTNAVLDAVRNSDKGYDIMNVDDLATALQDEDIWREGREIGLKRGIPISVVDYMTSGLAGRFLKVGSVASRTTKVAAGVGERFIYDPAAEALGEFTAQVVAGQDISLQEITAEALGALGSKAPMAGINMYMDARNKTNVGIANDLADINFMANESSSDGAITKWANNMERLGHITAEQNQRIQENVAIRREARDLLNVGSGKVPMPFTASNKVQARTMELLAARDELTSTQNRRAVFGSKVAEINAELQELVTDKKLRPRDKQTILAGTGVTEASRQATGTDIREGIKTYSINDKAYTREEFLSRIADMSEKQLKKANVAVKNDDSVLDILRKKGKEIAQKVEETSVLRPKGDDEGVDLTAPTYEAPVEVTSPTAEAFATVNRNDGKGTVTLTEDEYNAEMEKFAPVEEAVAPSEQITQKRQEEEVTQKPEEFRKPLLHLLSEPNKGRADLIIGKEELDSKIEDSFTYTTRGTVKKTYPVDIEIYSSENGKRYIAKDKDGDILASAFVDNNNKIVGVITDVGYENVGIGTNLIKKVQEDNPKAKPDELTSKQGERLAKRVGLEQTLKPEQDAIQEPSTETVDVQEPARNRQAVGEGDVRETAEEVDTEEQKAKVKQEADDLADALGLDDDVKFQLETDMTDKQRKETLEKEAEDLMNEVQPENVETVESVEAAEPIPVNLDEGAEPVKRTGIKRFRLRDIVGKKLNLLMADKLKIELKDPSKPYDQETNPYVKMGGNFFPLMEKIFGKAAWASIDKTAANKIIIGAMNGDLSVVYNMGDGGVDSNIAMAEALDNAIPENRKDEIFQLIKERVLGSNGEKIKKAHKHFKDAKTLMEAFESLANTESRQKDGTMKKEGVDVRAAVTRLILPTESVNSRKTLHVKLKELGITLEKLREENAEQFAKELPDGALTMVVEVQDENGVPVRERKLAIDKELADGKITDKEYEAKYNAIIDSARMSVEQQKQEGIPSHRNYPVYIRGKAVGIMEETASFFNVIPEYRQKINERVSGIDKKKTGEVKEGVTKVEEGIYNQIKEAKKDSTSVDSKKEIIKALLKGDVKKLKSGEVKSQTIALLKDALKLNNKAGIKEILTKAETPFAETTQYSAGEMRSAAMSSAMGTSTTSYEIVEYLKDQHERFLGRLSKAFPTVDVVLSQNEFDAIIANAQAKKLVTANQKVYGAVYEGKLYLNPNLPNYNTPIHEFGHVWLNVARELGKDTYKRGMALMDDKSPYYQQVINSKEYGKIIDKMRKDGVSEADINTYIKEEALATAIGDKGESFASAAQKKNFKNWLNELFEFIGKLTGISELTPDQLQNITLDAFVQGVVVDLMSENEVFAGAEVKSFGEQLQLMTVPENSMTKIIEFGRAENFSDASIKELLKKRGFSVAEINKAMVVNIDMQTQLPSEFNRVKDGVTEASQMFNDVRDKLRTFAKGKQKKIPAKKLTAEEKKAKANELRQLNPSLFDISDDEILKKYPEPAQYEVISAPTMSEVRAKAIELLREHPVFQKQSDAVQGAILVGFDKTIGTKANKKVQDVINNIKNKAKAMRQGVRDIKDAQSQLKAALKDMPMSNDIRRIIKAVGDVNQDNILAQLERITELVDNIRSKEAVSDAQKRALQMKIAELKKNAKDLATLKGQMRRFIGQSLPVSDTYTEGQMKKVNAIIDKINFDNQVEQVQKVLDIVEGQRSKMRDAIVKRMLDNAKKYATKQRKGKLVAKAGSVEAQGQMFFEEAAKILKYAYNNDTESMLKLAQELSDLDSIDEVIQKEINGESLTQQERALLDRVYAFDTFGDIMSMDLEDVMNLENAMADVKKESSIRLKNARLERSERYAKLSKESKNQIKKGFRKLFTINGVLKTKNQLGKTAESIREEFEKNGTIAGLKKIISKFYDSDEGLLKFVKDVVLNMTSLSTVLDKGGTFFMDNIVNPLKDADENSLKGYQQQLQKLDDLANAVRGIDGGLKQVMKLLKGKGMFVAGIEQSTDAQIASIKAMVDENPTDAKTLANAKKLMAEVITDRMEYLGMSKSDIKAQIKAINETIDATTLVKEQVKFIEEISKLKQINGITLNKGQLLRVYALSKNDVQREKLKGQGFTDEVMTEIEQFLGPELIAFADNVVDYLSGQYYESVNDVHVRVNDVNLDFVENYFPTRSLMKEKAEEYSPDSFAKTFGQMSPSAISQRVDTKSGIDLNHTFQGEIKRHFQQMEKYKAYAETVNTINKILAFDHVNALLEQTGTKKMYYMAIDGTVNPVTDRIPFFDKLMSRFYGMVLGFKLIQIPKQASSFINAYEQYSLSKDGKKKSLGVLGPDLMGFAYDVTKVALTIFSSIKKGRDISATFNQRVIDALRGDVFSLEAGSKIDEEQVSELRRWFSVATAGATTLGDILGVMGYMAVYNRNIANGMSHEQAVKIFNDYNETQQSKRGVEASPIQIMARKQPMLRMLTMFSSVALLQMNKIYQSSIKISRDLRNKKIPKKSDVRALYLNAGVANVMFVLAGNMVKLIKGDDEDREEVYYDMLKAMMFVNQLKMIPLVGSAVGAAEAVIEGKPAIRGIQGPLDRLVYDVAKSIKDEDYTSTVSKVISFFASTNTDPFFSIYEGATEGFEDEVIYDTLGLPKSARPKGEEEKKGGSGGRFTTRSSTR